MTQLVSRFNAGFIAILSSILAVSTILVCYIIATSLGHVPVWMPDITHWYFL